MKPTCLSGTLRGLSQLENCRCPGVSPSHSHGKSTGLGSQGEFLTRRLQTYPPGMCEAIADLIIQSFDHMWETDSGPGGACHPERLLRVSAWGSRQRLAGGSAMSILNEDVVKGKGLVITPEQCCTYVHVDDGIVVGDRRAQGIQKVNAWMETFANSLHEQGFIVNERNPDAQVEKVVGYAPRRSPAQLRLVPSKAASLYNELHRLHRM